MLGTKINEILYIQDLFELSDRVEAIITSIKKSKNPVKALLKFYNSIHEELVESSDLYLLLDNEHGALSFLDQSWYYCGSYEEDIASLESVAKNIRNSFIAPQGKRISSGEIARAMDIALMQFDLRDYFLKHPIEIALLNHSHADWNSLYQSKITPDGRLIDLIVMTHVRHDCTAPQEVIFLHELGHLLHTRISGLPGRMPKSFFHLLSKVVPDESYYLALQKSDFKEAFAEFFVVAATFGYKISRHAPYSCLKKYRKQKIYDYMYDLLHELAIKD